MRGLFIGIGLGYWAHGIRFELFSFSFFFVCFILDGDMQAMWGSISSSLEVGKRK